jgi:hypothetical protein
MGVKLRREVYPDLCYSNANRGERPGKFHPDARSHIGYVCHISLKGAEFRSDLESGNGTGRKGQFLD